MEPRVHSKIIDGILNGDNIQCRANLRVNYNSFVTIVQYIPGKHHGWSVEFEVICFLYWMACGCSYRVAGNFMGFSRYTTKTIVHKMLDIFIGMKAIINHGGSDEFVRIGNQFAKKAKSNAFRNVIGAIDGTHVRIKCPVHKHDEFINHKKYYSIQVQAVVDSQYMFKDVFIGFPGSVHDTRVFVNSPLYKTGSYPPSGYYLLGDKGYPCQVRPVAIITPFKEPLTSAQRRYNTAHSRARITVECSFGMTKTRWRNIYNRELELSVKNCCKTIFSAFVLHNICVMKGDFCELDLNVPDESNNNSRHNQNDESLQDSEEGLSIRYQMFNEFLQNSSHTISM